MIQADAIFSMRAIFDIYVKEIVIIHPCISLHQT